MRYLPHQLFIWQNFVFADTVDASSTAESHLNIIFSQSNSLSPNVASEHDSSYHGVCLHITYGISLLLWLLLLLIYSFY